MSMSTSSKTSRRTLAKALVLGGLVAAAASTVVLASGTYIPSLSIPNREEQELKRGENIFNNQRLGRSRKACSSCHNGENPFNRENPALTKANIPKLILYCLSTRVENTKLTPSDRKFRSLELYTTRTFKLDEPLQPENQNAMRILEKAKADYGNGEFESAIDGFSKASQDLVKPRNQVEAYFLLGMCHFILADTPSAKAAWEAGARVDPSYDPNPDLFSPKALAVYYQTRAKARQ